MAAGTLPGAAFGATVRLTRSIDEELPADLPATLVEAGGLLLLPGLGEITSRPELLVKLSYLFGPEVEDYRTLLTRVTMAHETVPEIFMVTNMVPGARPPPRVAHRSHPSSFSAMSGSPSSRR